MRNSLLLVTIAFAVAAACGLRPEPRLAPEVILTQMRADTVWIHELDSLAAIAIGPGARCLDPVCHTFEWEGRTWLFNQDWGGVLEIPSDYLPEDDLWQAELSFHGTRAWSPDSLILVSFYAGFQALTPEESKAVILSGLEDDGFAVQRRDEKENVLTLRARSAEGINYYGRHILGENGVEYSVSVQYPDRKASEAQEVIEKADRYPVGPNGVIPVSSVLSSRFNAKVKTFLFHDSCCDHRRWPYISGIFQRNIPDFRQVGEERRPDCQDACITPK